MSEPEIISKILSCYAEIENYSQEVRSELEEQLEVVRKRRRELVESARREGLRIKECSYHHALDDLFDTDDTGKLVDTNFKVKVLTRSELVKAINFCRNNRLMAMPIGARTSALGVFDARSYADREGLKGIVGLEFENISYSSEHTNQAPLLLDLPNYDPAAYELIIDQGSGALALLKSLNFHSNPELPHRVFALAGTHISDVNRFLNVHLANSRYTYRIMPDPTSWAEAQIGGIIATGAEGGNRTKASDDLLSLQVVDANGVVRNLTTEQSKCVVGTNGNAGAIYQAEFAVSAFPRYEHGIFVSVKGKGLDAWRSLFRLQHVLKPFARSLADNPRLQVGDAKDGIIITSIEPLSLDALKLACGEVLGDFERKLLNLVGASEFGVFITFNSFLEAEDLDLYQSELFSSALKLNLEELEGDADENFELNEHCCIDKIRLLSGQELVRMDQIRHEAPSHARELAKRMGGVTESTDLNIRFESESETEAEQAFDKVAEIYHGFTSSFTAEEGFKVVVYGHLHPGVGEGGGLDPHVRVIFELSNPGSRYNAPEQAQFLKKRQAQFYKKLLALDGQLGIQILSPEKSRFTNTEYWNWFCLKYPEQATIYLKTVADLGYADLDGERVPIIGARVPHALPGVFSGSYSVCRLFNPDYVNLQGDTSKNSASIGELDIRLRPYLPAVLELSQSSHRGGRGRRLLRSVRDLLNSRLGLGAQHYVFYMEDLSEAQEIIRRNELEPAYVLNTFQPSNISELALGCPKDSNEIVGIDLSKMGIPDGLALLIVPHSAVWDVYQRMLAGGVKAFFRNLVDLWNGWPFETMETPNLPAIACLGILLEVEGQQVRVPQGKAGKMLCLVPGPVQIPTVLFEKVEEVWSSGVLSADEYQRILKDFKEFIGVPEEHELAFYSSATQCMQVLADSIEKSASDINLIQVVNDAFGERLASILGKTGRPLNKIYTPWTTSENSQLEVVVSKIIAALRTEEGVCNLLFITPHKTATTADVLPDHLVSALKQRGLLMGRDYQMICDVTSGLGARNYATLLAPDTGRQRLPFIGLFSGAQKALGLPSGLAFISLAPALVKLLAPANTSSLSPLALQSRINAARSGNLSHRFHIFLLGLKLRAEQEMSRSIAEIELECRSRMNLLLGWVERHPDLMCLVPNSKDRSPLILGVFSQAKNLMAAKRLLAEIFNINLGSGYGPFERESVRLYLANISYSQLKFVLAAFDLVLELDDVVHTRGEKVPNIALREPHDPLSVISRVATECSVDDIIKDQLGLEWVGRLVKTYNANVPDSAQKMRLGGKIPWSSVGHQEKSRIYGESKNLREMRKILTLRSEETKLDLLYHFQLFKETEIHLRNRVLSNPHAVWQDDSFSATIEDLLARARMHLGQMEVLLWKYANPSSSTDRLEYSASRDKEGRVEWPIVA
jgi:aspartate aminotransferase-like enzyme